MDFMKILDQTVREIKREVNIKVLKIPEIEQKVLDATSDEPWGPHGSALSEIAHATKKFECHMVMDALWIRLTEGSRNWRHVYKALAVIEYLVGHGSERAVDDIIEHSFQISSLSGFEHVEPSGKDMGINVRKKAETILALLSDNEKIQELRDKAAATQNKFFGLSSTGITYKSSSTSQGSGSIQHGGRYGSLSARKEKETFKDGFRNRGLSGDDEFGKSSRDKSRKGVTGKSEAANVKKEPVRHGRDCDVLPSSAARQLSESSQSIDNRGPIPSQSSVPSTDPEDDFDDFDPRGTSNADKTVSVNEVDLFGNLMDAPPQMSTGNDHATTEVDLFADANDHATTEVDLFADANDHATTKVDLFADENDRATTVVDLFADAAFVSATPHIESGVSSEAPATVDLFASQPNFTSASSSTLDFSVAPQPVPTTENKSQSQDAEKVTVPTADPFSGVPVNSYNGSDSDLFGAFTSRTDQVTTDPTKNSGQENNLENIDQKTMAESEPSPKKDVFQVKSGIWADSLTRGLIDLNITAPKKVNLSDIGIVGELSDISDDKEKVIPASAYMDKATGMGPVHVNPGFTSSPGVGIGDSSSIFSNLSQQHQQCGNFKN